MSTRGQRETGAHIFFEGGLVAVLTALSPVLIMLAVTFLVVVGGLALAPRSSRAAVLVTLGLGCGTGQVVASAWLPGMGYLPSTVAALVLVGCVTAHAVLCPADRFMGAAVWVTWLAFGTTAALWSVVFLADLRLSPMTRVLLWTTIALAGITLPSAVITTREGWAPLWRRRRPRVLPPDTYWHPMVSIHVPCHAEPPEIVISTLNRLADLDYPRFEVLVIDNNTTDASLWLPVQAHCAALGPHFRFLHVEGITGAKAGALNWAMPFTHPDADLIGVVDADYHVEPDWLRNTVGYFNDQRLGFVQCPHAYRDYDDAPFGTWANWEYSVFFAAGMVSLDQAGAGLTVGTMSLIRRRVLDEVGGWAEWCLTEDSELAVRIHAAGYDSIYLTEKYGRGLIPATFEGYRRQRFRWTYGPVQEFQRHWRLFLPTWLGGRASRLSTSQKLHHANHGIDVIGVGLRALAIPFGGLTAASMLLHHEHIAVPVALWAASTSALISSLLIRYLVYTRVVRASISQAIGATITFAALSFVIATASLKATLRRPAHWHRTDKTPSSRHGIRVLATVRTEAALSLALLSIAGCFVIASPHTGLTTMLAISLATQALALSAAVVTALVADRSLPSGQQTTVTEPVLASYEPSAA